MGIRILKDLQKRERCERCCEYIYIFIFDDLEAWTQCREGGREGGIEPVRNIQNPQNILLMPT